MSTNEHESKMLKEVYEWMHGNNEIPGAREQLRFLYMSEQERKKELRQYRMLFLGTVLSAVIAAIL